MATPRTKKRPRAKTETKPARKRSAPKTTTRHKKSAVKSPSVAVIGCGNWGRNLVRNFHELGALGCICDSNDTVIDAMQNSYGTENRSFAEILSDETILAVAIAAPAEQHYTLAREALLAGKHVFVEKPLALEVDQAEKLCTLAETRKQVLMVGHLLQYHPVFFKLRDLISRGELGRIQYLYSNRLNLGKIRREENILWSFAPHDLSMILSIVGEEPEFVTAEGGRYLHKEIADVTITNMTFPSGIQAHVFVSWLHPLKEQRLVIIGDRQMAVFDDTQPWERKLTLYAHRVDWREGHPEPFRADGVTVPVDAAEPLRLECQHFLDCAASGKPARTDGREGLRVLRVLAAAERAMSTDKSSAMQLPQGGGSAGFMVHETAVVDTPSEIGEGTKIWHFSHVLNGSVIGKNCVLGQNVMVGPKVHIGDNCKIQNNVSIYEGVELEDDVFCGPSSVFTNVYNPRATVERKNEIRKTVIRKGATIGANATIVCGTTLGEYSFIGAGAVVNREVPAFGLVVGVPCKRIGWVSHDGEILGEDLVCPRSGRAYRLKDAETLVEIVDK